MPSDREIVTSVLEVASIVRAALAFQREPGAYTEVWSTGVKR